MNKLEAEARGWLEPYCHDNGFLADERNADTVAAFLAAFAAKAVRDREREIAGELRAVVDSGSTNIVFEQELRAFIAKLEAE